jgi:uncharacterized protein YceH (UPF0502 family)
MEPLSPEELRVVACLVEKQLTTPDSYPLTENAVVTACNQLSNRNPIVAYDNNTVRVTLTELRQRGLARVIHTPGARVPKHRHILDDALGLSKGEVSILAVLALRGPQTVGELRTRTERMHDFTGLSEVEEILEGLASRDEPLVVRLERQPGQKEARYAHLLSGPVDAAASSGLPAASPSSGSAAHAAPATAADAAVEWAEEDRPQRATASAAGPAAAPAGAGRPDRVAALEERLTALEAELAILRAEHHELRAELGLEGRPLPGGDSAGTAG